MTNEEAVRMLKAKLACLSMDVSGCYGECNEELCDECPLNYEQGNMGEQKEYIRMSIEALKQQPCGDAISRQAVLDEIENYSCLDKKDIKTIIKALPPVTPQQKMGYISIDDVMSVFDDFMCGEVDEDGTNTFLEMLKDKSESEE